MRPRQAPMRVPAIEPDSRRARHSMSILSTGESQDGRGQEHTFNAGQLGSRDAGKTTLNREGLLVKTDDELLDDIRQTALAIRDASDEIPLIGSMTIAEIQRLESYGNALAIFCKLLRQRLEAQDPAIQHLRATLAEGE
jgi:hypothetical protein